MLGLTKGPQQGQLVGVARGLERAWHAVARQGFVHRGKQHRHAGSVPGRVWCCLALLASIGASILQAIARGDGWVARERVIWCYMQQYALYFSRMCCGCFFGRHRAPAVEAAPAPFGYSGVRVFASSNSPCSSTARPYAGDSWHTSDLTPGFGKPAAIALPGPCGHLGAGTRQQAHPTRSAKHACLEAEGGTCLLCMFHLCTHP